MCGSKISRSSDLLQDIFKVDFLNDIPKWVREAPRFKTTTGAQHGGSTGILWLPLADMGKNIMATTAREKVFLGIEFV